MILSNCIPTQAQVNQPIYSQPTVSTISVSGTGSALAIPNVVDIQFSVDFVGTDPINAVSQNSAKMNEMMAVMETMNIPASDIQTNY